MSDNVRPTSVEAAVSAANLDQQSDSLPRQCARSAQAGFTLAELLVTLACSCCSFCFSHSFSIAQQLLLRSATSKWTRIRKRDNCLIEWQSISPRW